MDNFWTFYQSMPTVTRFYITSCVLCTLGVQLDLISPFQLYFNYNLIFIQHEYWRLITTFLFFGTFSFTFMFNIMFTYRYSRFLEEGSFRSNSADFFFMLLFGATLMIIIAPFVKLLFLGHAFTVMLVYIWAKRNTQIHLNFFGLFDFRAPHLPWVLLGFSLILGNSILTDLMGICVGHIYYYLQDVFPYLPGGFRCLKTPRFIVYLFNPNEYYMQRLNSQINVSENSSNNLTNESDNQSETFNRTRNDQVNDNESESNRQTSSNDNINNTIPHSSNEETQSNQKIESSAEINQNLRNRFELNKNKSTNQTNDVDRSSQ